MALPLEWTPAQDHAIKIMRADGKTWTDISLVLKVSREAIGKRAKVLGIWRPFTPKKTAKYKVHPTPTREAYPPGHPETWGAITAGTILAGMRYPEMPMVSRVPVEERMTWAQVLVECRANT